MRWPEGFASAGVAAGIKPDGALDVGLLAATGDPLEWAGTFTQNAAAAAPVRWSRNRLRQTARAVVVNSGNANACTGENGEIATRVVAGEVAAAVGCEPAAVLTASTGPIGIELPADKIAAAIPAAVSAMGSDATSFAHAILTTDTVVKHARAHTGGADIFGVAKGAAMLAPRMATMLAFVTTDAAVEPRLLQSTLDSVVRRTFDRISVDACESTNDSVFLLSSGLARPVDPDTFAKGLFEVCSSLAEQMVRDAEGGSKFVRIHIRGAAEEDEAAAFGRAVAASALWRAALHGGDPNWGRVLSALGTVDRALDLSAVSVDIGDVRVFARGAPTGELQAAAEQMKDTEIVVRCTVGRGPGWAEILTTDLSPEYVTLNATGTS